MKSVICNECTSEYVTNNKLAAMSCLECGSKDVDSFDLDTEDFFEHEWDEEDDDLF